MISPDENAASDTPPKRDFRAFFTSGNWSGLKLRAISASVLVTVALVAVLSGGLLFTTLIMLAALLMIREWDYITTAEKPGWKWLGLAYVALPCLSMIWLRSVQFEENPEAGRHIVMYLLLVVWSTDIGAYFAGRAIGGPKLAPAISPNKTWAGLAGGVAAAMLVGGFCSFFSPYPRSFVSAMVIGGLLAVVAQGGDLFESWIKRRAGVKDSGTLIPGHGGILDRIDGLTFSTPLLAFMLSTSGLAL